MLTMIRRKDRADYELPEAPTVYQLTRIPGHTCTTRQDTVIAISVICRAGLTCHAQGIVRRTDLSASMGLLPLGQIPMT